MYDRVKILLTTEEALAKCNRLEKEILTILFDFRPIMTNRMKLEAAQKIAGLIKPREVKK